MVLKVVRNIIDASLTVAGDDYPAVSSLVMFRNLLAREGLASHVQEAPVIVPVDFPSKYQFVSSLYFSRRVFIWQVCIIVGVSS